MIRNFIVALSVLLWVGMAGSLAPARAQGNDSQNWDAIVDAGKAEGKVVVSIPTSAKLRKDFEAVFENQFPGIKLELDVGRGSSNIRKILSENNAGVHSVDIHIGGTTSIITGLLAADLLEPVMPSMVLPEVKDAGQWWGGHMWIDNAKRYIYSFTGYMTETLWYNIRPGQSRRNQFLRQSAGTEMEAKDRHPGSPDAGLGRIDVGVFLAHQRGRVS